MNKFAICIESSHSKGMGHLFRALNLIEAIKSRKIGYVVLINDDKKSVAILKKRNVLFRKVDLNDTRSDWENTVIRKYGVSVWINDRLDTDIKHSRNVKKNGVKLVTFDDKGSGASITDVNFGSLPDNFNRKLKGKKVFAGLEYLILNRDIYKYKRVRNDIKKIVVCLGGSDTYGVTVKVLKILKKIDIAADIITGPCFQHMKELRRMSGKNYRIIRSPDSLIRQFRIYDLAVTGGGIMPFEANASGLPCIIVANEKHEIGAGIFLSGLGSSIFAGYHTDINQYVFGSRLNIKRMSKAGLRIKTNGVDIVCRIINSL